MRELKAGMRMTPVMVRGTGGGIFGGEGTMHVFGSQAEVMQRLNDESFSGFPWLEVHSRDTKLSKVYVNRDMVVLVGPDVDAEELIPKAVEGPGAAAKKAIPKGMN